MRIISGKYRGKQILAPQNLPVRPTTDFAKEALFNILNFQFDFEKISVIDLFAGTGNISYEFASRGTEDIRSVDRDAGCIRFISQTAERLFPGQITPVRSDVFRFLSTDSSSADLIFADPPYDLPQSDMERIVTLVFENRLLSEGGILIVEHSRNTVFDHLPQWKQTRRYGNVNFSFFDYPAE